ncbi:carbohydrate ABC transporter permease, partial [Rhizobium ruizarguesonis]
VDVWKGVGLATLIFIAGLAAISPDYNEAARIDGATRLQQFFRITLPRVMAHIRSKDRSPPISENVTTMTVAGRTSGR